MRAELKFDIRDETTRYFIVQHLANPWRQEPRNVGVIVWCPDQTEARFRGEHPQKTGVVKDAPKFLDDPSSYVFWLHTWRNVLSKESITPLRGGPPVQKTDSRFMEVFKEFTNQHYILVDGSYLSGVTNISEVADYLFESLVLDADQKTHEPTDERVDWACSRLLKDTDLKSYAGFRNHYEYMAGSDSIPFSYALLRDEIPTALYEEVPLSGGNKDVERNVFSTIGKFSQVKTNHIDRFALIYLSKERSNQESILREVRRLDQRSTVINLANERNRAELEKVWSTLVAESRRAEPTTGIFAAG